MTKNLHVVVAEKEAAKILYESTSFSWIIFTNICLLFDYKQKTQSNCVLSFFLTASGSRAR